MAVTTTELANLALSLNGVTKQLTALGTDGTTEDDHANLWFGYVRDELIEQVPWNEYIQHRALVLTSGYYEYNQEYDYDPITITGITAADPAVVTATSHGFSTGDNVYIYNVIGMTEVNRDNPYHVTKVTDDTFQLTGINSTNWTAYTSGGKCYKKEPLSRYQSGYVYDLPSDFVFAIGLEGGYDFELKGISGDVKLLTTVDDAILKYIRSDFSDPTKWTGHFNLMFASKLAIKLAPALLGVKEARFHIRDVLQPMYDRELNEAILMNTTNKKRTAERTDPWVVARGGGSRRSGYWVDGQFIYSSQGQKNID